MLRALFIFLPVMLAGCVSQPYRDDSTRHLNQLTVSAVNKQDLRFNLVGEQSVDLRGQYSNDDSLEMGGMLYQGVGGIGGLIAQIGAHSATVHSMRSKHLSEQQQRANQQVAPVIMLAEGILLSQLAGRYPVSQTAPDSTGFQLNARPLFYVSQDMQRFSLKLVVWLGDADNTEENAAEGVRYRNLIQVDARELSQQELNKLLNDKDLESLRQLLAGLMQTGLNVVVNELTGEYTNADSAQRTFIRGGNNQKAGSVIRGTLVDSGCGYQVIRDLHSWLIVLPDPAEIVPDDTCEAPAA